MQIKIYKNLFQFLSELAGVLLIDTIMLIAYFEVPLFKRNLAWILLACALFFSATALLPRLFYYFQKVIIDETGMKIVIFSKKF